jgi:8-oxo-dGTP pyrophosphatase MutT (NUDIX family)
MAHFPDTLYRYGLKLAFWGFVAFCFIFRPRTRGVVVAVRFQDQVLIIKNSYYTKYTLPGGYIKRGEAPREAAVRELAEEVGLIIAPGRLCLKRRLATTIHYKREILSFFEVRLRSLPELRIDNQEVIWAAFLSLRRALVLDLSSDVRQCLGLLDRSDVR